MRIAEAAEMYLETILILEKRKGSVRAIDISTEMGYARPTVSVKLKQFVENGYVTIDEGGLIRLTEAGRAIAERTWTRHNILTGLLVSVGVSEATARQDACRVEHYISEETFACLRDHYRAQLGKKNSAG